MIFSSQLGKLDGRNTEQSIQSVANHLRKMQEELEYRLSVLDSSNITEINADETSIFAQGKDINNIITDQEGRMSQFQQTVEGFNNTVAEYGESVSEYEQTVDGFRTTVGNYGNKVSEYAQTVDGFNQTVADYEKGVSQYKQTVDGFTTQVTNYEKQYSTWEQTVNGFRQQVADYTTGYSSWEQTVNGFRQQVANYEGQYSSLEQTVSGFRQQVGSYEWQYSSLEQTVDGFRSQVSNYENQVSSYEQTVSGFQWTVQNLQTDVGTALRLDENGLYIVDKNGNVVTISGDQIDADTIKVNNLYGETIYLNAPANNGAYYTAARIVVTDSSSNPFGSAVELASGAVRLKAVSGGGDVHIESNSGYVSLVAAGHISMKSDVLPGGADAYTLGSSSYKWKDVYSVNSEINTSDRTKKNSIEYDMTRYEKLFDLLKPCSYKLNDGTSDRKHIGMISQDVEEALETAELTTQDFAGFIKSPAQDEKGNVIEGEYDYALRYGEFIGLCIAEIQKLKTRVDELERKATDNG